LELLIPLRHEVMEKMDSVSRSTCNHNLVLKNWLSGIRLSSRQLLPLPGYIQRDNIVFYYLQHDFIGCGDMGDKLKTLLAEISANVNPNDIIVLAEAGSKMYGLSTPTSDTDYIIVYRNSTQDIIATTVILKVSLGYLMPSISNVVHVGVS